MFGKMLIIGLFGVSLITTLIYVIKMTKENKNFPTPDDGIIKAARVGYFLTMAGIVAASALLMQVIVSHNFSYAYVYNYSSKQMPFGLLLSSFYAGQEGSLLLWALFFAITGYFVYPKARKNGYEATAMGLFMFFVSFILLMLIVKSPFEMLWEAFPQGASKDVLPLDGRGMNPILENYWMIIHPPVLFLGYTFLAMPFIYAVAGIFRNDYDTSVKLAAPWALASAAVLGAGIMLGGFWAYETLGWGGFWGWDPVENSSLVPWIVVVALTHTMIVQRKTGALKKTNITFSILAFSLVLYATFLTRSGVLSEASVHSFGDPGKGVYAILLAFLIASLLLGFAPLFIKFKKIPVVKLSQDPTSREFSLALGVAILLATCALILLGTSWPVITKITGAQSSSIEPQFYNQWTLPLSIILMLVNVYSLFLSKNKTIPAQIIKKSIPSLVVSIVLTAVLVAYGVNEAINILFSFTSIFTLAINLEMIVRIIRKKPSSIGAYLSHAGIGLMMLGIIGSGIYAERQVIGLAENETKELFGYKFTMIGYDEITKQRTDQIRYEYKIKAEGAGFTDVIRPVVYYSDFNGRQAPFFEPGIARFMFEDVYISPKSSEDKYQVTLMKTQTENVPVGKNIQFQLGGFDMERAHEHDADTAMAVGAIVFYKTPKAEYIDTLITLMNFENGVCTPIWKLIPETDYMIGFGRFVPDQKRPSMSQAMFVFAEKTDGIPKPLSKEVFTVEIDIKPFINLVWAGVILTVLGYFIAMAKRNKEA